MELLKKLYKIYSPSGKEWAITKFIWNYVKEIQEVRIEIDKMGNLYIVKGESESYPCVVAHLDQVQRLHSKDFMPIETKDIIFGYSPNNKRQEGLGADDKNGIWIALKCLEKYDTLKVAFFVSEEIGCIGSSKADMEFFKDCRFIVEPDRRGYQDIIIKIGWTSLCSPEFLKDINYEKFGYRVTDGMMTDIQELKERGFSGSCINLSCGYYEPHTDHEFTIKKDLLKCLSLVQNIIENCNKVYYHQSESSKHDYQDDIYEAAREDIFSVLDTDPSITVDDLFYMYQTNYSFLDREEIEEIYNEYFELEEAEDYEKGGSSTYNIIRY